MLISAMHAASVAREPNLAESVLLIDAVEQIGARCLDGSPQRLWIQRSTSSNPANRSKWYFHFMGGGWCKSQEACTARAYSASDCYRGSSNETCFNANGDNTGAKFNSIMDFIDIPCINGARWGGGLLNNNPLTNPLSWDWNKVEMQYCDGGSYGGDNETVTRISFGGKEGLPLYYRGRRNLQATMNYLLEHEGMDKATTLLVSGDSAGGLATYWHADAMQQIMDKVHADSEEACKVLAVPDSGFFLSDSSKPAWAESLGWIVEAMNATSGLNQACVKAQEAGDQAVVKCALPEEASKYISAPLFVLNSRFDPALISICTSGKKTAQEINAIGDEVLAKINSSVLLDGEGNIRGSNAAFVTACSEHCGQWGQGQEYTKWSDFNVSIDGDTAAFAVNAWYAHVLGRANESLGEAQQLWLQKAAYPCAGCCHGGN